MTAQLEEYTKQEECLITERVNDTVWTFLYATQIGYLKMSKMPTLIRKITNAPAFDFDTARYYKELHSLTDDNYYKMVDQIVEDFKTTDPFLFELDPLTNTYLAQIGEEMPVTLCSLFSDAMSDTKTVNMLAKEKVKEVTVMGYNHTTYGMFYAFIIGRNERDNYVHSIRFEGLTKKAEKVCSILNSLVRMYMQHADEDLKDIYLHKGKCERFYEMTGKHPYDNIGYVIT